MLQIYTGNGKGKTTAAIGLAMRAVGAGYNVYIMQFMKSLAYSEQKVLQSFTAQVTLHTTGKPCFIVPEGTLSDEELKKFGDGVVVFPKGHPPDDYIALIKAGLHTAIEEINSKKYQVIILDEIVMALYFELLTRQDLEMVLSAVSEDTELILTGRYAPQWLIDRADLVTEMREIKHYYQKGIEARKGIEC